MWPCCELYISLVPVKCVVMYYDVRGFPPDFTGYYSFSRLQKQSKRQVPGLSLEMLHV